MNLQFVEKLRAAAASGTRFAVITVVETSGSSPQKAGAAMIVHPDGRIDGTVGGGAVEHRLIADAQDAMATGAPALKRYNLKKDFCMECGGTMTAYVDPCEAAPRVVVFGCGHVCRALAPVLASVGFRLTVVDDREQWAQAAAFPPSVEVVCASIKEFCAGLSDTRDLFVLSMTRGHGMDFQAARFFAGKELRYLGVMASRKKAVEFRKALLEDRVSQADVDAIRMPVGLPIGSTTPEEIAVSIAAELIQVRKSFFSLHAGGDVK